MDSGVLERSHGKLLFKVLSEAMQSPQRANDPTLRIEYRELFDAAEKCAPEVLNVKFRAQLEVGLPFRSSDCSTEVGTLFVRFMSKLSWQSGLAIWVSLSIGVAVVCASDKRSVHR